MNVEQFHFALVVLLAILIIMGVLPLWFIARSIDDVHVELYKANELEAQRLRAEGVI